MIGWLDVLLVLTLAMILGGVSVFRFPACADAACRAADLGRSRAQPGQGNQSQRPLRVGSSLPCALSLHGWALLPLETSPEATAPVAGSCRATILGLSEDELIAMCALSGLGLGAAGLLVCEPLRLPSVFALCALCLGVVGALVSSALRRSSVAREVLVVGFPVRSSSRRCA